MGFHTEQMQLNHIFLANTNWFIDFFSSLSFSCKARSKCFKQRTENNFTFLFSMISWTKLKSRPLQGQTANQDKILCVGQSAFSVHSPALQNALNHFSDTENILNQSLLNLWPLSQIQSQSVCFSWVISLLSDLFFFRLSSSYFSQTSSWN